MTKTYIGERDSDGTTRVYVREAGKTTHALALRLNLFNHSPTGFEWGYAGSGPAQLALALLADALADGTTAVALHQRYKFEVVAELPRDGWQLSAEQVRTVAMRIKRTK